MSDPVRACRPPAPRPPHPASKRILNRALAVLGAIDQMLERFARERYDPDLGVRHDRLMRIRRLLRTAEGATARHCGPGWRRRWPMEARVTYGEARVELLMATEALIATIAAADRARPHRPRRKLSPHPGSHGIVLDIRHQDGGRDERPVAERKPEGSPSGGPRDWTTG